MRLWSLDPAQLDGVGLVALWREGLLARAVLLGHTRGYQHHPQLVRFREAPDPSAAIGCYLSGVLDEAAARGYTFDTSKVARRDCPGGHTGVTRGQLGYEWGHLLAKLATRNPGHFRHALGQAPRPHRCFHAVDGPIARWERLP
jgi:hypothetical protein